MRDGLLKVAKKYRGSMGKVYLQYAKERMAVPGIDPRVVFLVHSGRVEERMLEEVRTVIRLLPEAQFVLDTKQAHMAGFMPEELLEAMGGRVRHVHALDVAAEGGLCLPGQGTIDWLGLMAKLRAQGFNGTVVLEPYDYLARNGAALTASVMYLKEAVQQSGR